MPSLEGAVKKIRSLMKAHQLDKVFVATDAIRKGRQLFFPWLGAGQVQFAVPLQKGQQSLLRLAEQEELRKLLPEMVRFEPTWEELELYKDGGVAIIDQWICAHARCLSTVSQRGLSLAPVFGN